MLALGATALRRAASSAAGAIAPVGGATARLSAPVAVAVFARGGGRAPPPPTPRGKRPRPRTRTRPSSRRCPRSASSATTGRPRRWSAVRRPLLDLVFDAASVHRAHHDPRQVQQCTLLSIKTGGCPETCNYCAQSSSWKETTELKAEKLMAMDDVLDAARRAKEAGSTRFCMGTAWARSDRRRWAKGSSIAC